MRIPYSGTLECLVVHLSQILRWSLETEVMRRHVDPALRLLGIDLDPGSEENHLQVVGKEGEKQS